MKGVLLGAIALLAVAGLVWLGVWQVQRRTAKLALIAQVERRLAAAPVDAPAPGNRVGPDDAYLRVVVRGVFRDDRATLVQAVTELGGGYWVMAPLATDRGFTLLVNRGFIPAEQRNAYLARHAMQGKDDRPTTVTGLLRLSEPGGGFLRTNDPAADRWYSRDVAAIAARRGIGPAAAYFIDADAISSPTSPRGGLTVVHFANNHLVYALTWFALAAMLTGLLALNLTTSIKKGRVSAALKVLGEDA